MPQLVGHLFTDQCKVVILWPLPVLAAILTAEILLNVSATQHTVYVPRLPSMAHTSGTSRPLTSSLHP